VDTPAKLMQVRDAEEGDAICARLRAAGVKCAVEPLPDGNWGVGMLAGLRARDVLYVLVNESDVPRARDALRAD
jgi:hypothetical protein